MAGWDDDNFEPQGLGGSNLSNKWEGEDEDDEVKDNWEDEEEEKEREREKEKEKKADEIAVVEVKQKSRKKLQDIIAEKERLKKEELEQHVKEKEEEEISPEEQLRRQQESDLKLALETTFGVSNKNLGVDGSTQPTNKEEFQELAENLTKNVQQFAKSEDYPIFAESLVRGVCATLNSFDLKKIKTTIDNLYLEKQRIEKGDKSRKNKGKGKAKLKMDGDNLNQYSAYVDDYDYDDFM